LSLLLPQPPNFHEGKTAGAGVVTVTVTVIVAFAAVSQIDSWSSWLGWTNCRLGLGLGWLGWRLSPLLLRFQSLSLSSLRFQSLSLSLSSLRFVVIVVAIVVVIPVHHALQLILDWFCTTT
jgi:hypothetical protein